MASCWRHLILTKPKAKLAFCNGTIEHLRCQLPDVLELYTKMKRVLEKYIQFWFGGMASTTSHGSRGPRIWGGWENIPRHCWLLAKILVPLFFWMLSVSCLIIRSFGKLNCCGILITSYGFFVFIMLNVGLVYKIFLRGVSVQLVFVLLKC